MSEQFLYQKMQNAEEWGLLQDVPAYIERFLSERIILREYQHKALQYFITYYESKRLRQNKQIHTLFHMATGSGKTVIMGGLIPYLYTKGFRKFLFFVNLTNIIEKTKENFLNSSSGKYLFAESLEIDGQHIPIRTVDNFAAIDENAINICFTTTQKLHLDLTFPRENTLTIEDFEDDKIVLISDESHHVNTLTKRKTKAQEEADTSWEYSVKRIFEANRENILLEFTATCDLKDPGVLEKYTDKIIYDYSLPVFRESGYTKDFQNLQSNFSPWQRTLGALILSEYRRSLFASCGQNIKPVVLLKSRYISDSEEFYIEFFARLEQLSAEEIMSLDTPDNPLLSKAIQYFKAKDETLESLIHGLKLGFSEENSIIMNGSRDNTAEKQLAVNSLEEPSNPYRIIFTVDMLNEGWDVLNLFDIVRLYETRQSKNYTIQEAQLIGRGARYCPFVAQEGQERFKRKYDNDLDNENRILEALLYHSKQDSRYITELKTALKDIGLLPDNAVEQEYKLKEEFKATAFFKTGIVFSNKQVKKSREGINNLDEDMRYEEHYIRVASPKSGLYSLFEEDAGEHLDGGSAQFSRRIKLKELPLNLLIGVMNYFNALRFDKLKALLPNLRSKREFLISPNYIGNNVLVIDSDKEELTAQNLLEATERALSRIASNIRGITTEYEGSKEFYEKPVRDVIRNKKIQVTNPSEDGEGISQKVVIEELNLDLSEHNWYIYGDNFGTTEEKAFVKYFHSLVSELEEKYEEIYLVRNEQIAELAIYDFDTGQRSDPDFLLFLRREGQVQFEQRQIYIEAKGDHLLNLENEKRKENFLRKISEESFPVKVYADNYEYHIYGLPFFNKNYRQKEFEKEFREKLL